MNDKLDKIVGTTSAVAVIIFIAWVVHLAIATTLRQEAENRQSGMDFSTAYYESVALCEKSGGTFKGLHCVMATLTAN